MVRLLLVMVGVVALAGCAATQLKRDVAHADQTMGYMAAAMAGEAFQPDKQCGMPGKPKSWTIIRFDPQREILGLPTGLHAAAECLAIPATAKGVEIHGNSEGGITYHELTVIRPSLLLLDENHRIVADLQDLKMLPGEGFFSGFRVTQIVPLIRGLSAARYAVVYVHPLSTAGEVKVNTGHETIPVPFGPYGTVRVRFLE